MRGVEPSQDVRLRTRHPQRRRGNRLPEAQDLLHPVHGRERQLVPRIGAQLRAAVGITSAQCAARNTALSRGSRGFVLLQPVGDRGEARVRLNAGRIAQRVEPLRRLSRRGVGRFARECRTRRARRARRTARAARRRSASTTLPPRLWPARLTAHRARSGRAALRDRRRSPRTSSPAVATPERPKPRRSGAITCQSP